MTAQSETIGSRPCWFVGASFGGVNDQMPRFLEQGIWENGCKNRYIELVKSMRPGDRIAIKSAYTRKHDLPFDNSGETVSVMAIKAIGTITQNMNDGHFVRVDWTKLEPREWYFYTNRSTVWRVIPGDWMTDALLAFAFENRPQDVDRFRNAPYWRERFGEKDPAVRRFKWSSFYEAMADKLVGFKDRRSELLKGIYEIAQRVDGLPEWQDRFSNGSTGPLQDICPFTVMGMFNRGITDINRQTIAGELANLLGVEEEVPQTFEGVPLLNNQRSWFFGFERQQDSGDIGRLWELFDIALQFSVNDDRELRDNFAEAYDAVTSQFGVGWNLTMGLYWIRPWSYATLESRSRAYISKRLNIKISASGPKGQCTASEYLTLLGLLEARFLEEAFSVHSYPELSYASWRFKESDAVIDDPPLGGEDPPVVLPSKPPVPVMPPVTLEPYSIDDIVNDGCFVDRSRLEGILERLRMKKNVILQGPPGTGKTWLARRLAFALMTQRNEEALTVVQFHPNLSYEDFVRGWRPSGEGKLTLCDGPFMELVNVAREDPGTRHVIVIEEINRGHPAQIFGEMLTLLEADKRTPNEAIELCYRTEPGERVYVPSNLYLIGTMNIADRSLALVDLALRRRFAFIDLEPELGDVWHRWCCDNCSLDGDFMRDVQRRILELNAAITADASLGPQFRVGHSYVTPPMAARVEDPAQWFRQVVATEIGPLLDEYWFDSSQKAAEWRQKLVAGI